MVRIHAITPNEAESDAFFSLWRDALLGVFDVACTVQQAADFRGEIHLYATGLFVLSLLRASPVRLVVGGPRREREPLDYFAVMIPRAGAFVYRSGDATIDIGPGDVLFLDFSREFEIARAGGGEPGEAAILWAPRARLLDLFADAALLHGATIRADKATGAALAATLAIAIDLAARATAGEFDAIAAGFVEMALRSGEYFLRDASGGAVAESLATFAIIRNFIDKNLSSTKLDADMLANVFGLSRASLFRMFAPVGGVATYIRQMRLGRAYRLITSPRFSDMRIGQIAHQMGFRHVGTFNRLFHSTFGVSPGAAREESLKSFQGVHVWKGDAKARGELLNRLALMRP